MGRKGEKEEGVWEEKRIGARYYDSDKEIQTEKDKWTEGIYKLARTFI